MKYKPSIVAGNTLVALACLAIAVAANGVLTTRMSLHMLVQVPLLVLAGLLAEQAWHGWRAAGGPSTRATPGWSCNEHGVPGLLLASLIGACWMIPKVLDDALTDWRVACFKFLGLPLCGWILRASLRRSQVVIKLFFLGNFCWMTAIAGMIYLDQPVRLCNAYLLDDQAWSGRGLIALAIMLPVGWLVAAAWSPLRRRSA